MLDTALTLTTLSHDSTFFNFSSSHIYYNASDFSSSISQIQSSKTHLRERLYSCIIYIIYFKCKQNLIIIHRVAYTEKHIGSSVNIISPLPHIFHK